MNAQSRGVAPGRRPTITASERERSNQKLADQMIAQSRDFYRATLDSLVAHIAVLDAEGEIVMSNRAWARFAIDNGAIARASEQNYLAVSDAAAGEQTAVEAAAGLRAIILGDLQEFSLEYPCHSPTLERWYLMHATRYTGSGEARVVVATPDRLSEDRCRVRKRPREQRSQPPRRPSCRRARPSVLPADGRGGRRGRRDAHAPARARGRLRPGLPHRQTRATRAVSDPMR
jgi:hypothetical protein